MAAGTIALRLATLLLALLGSGCAPRELVADVDAEPGPDGLVPLRGAGLGDAWIRPGTNLARYQRLRLEPLQFEFRQVAEVSPSARAMASEFPISDVDRERLVAEITTAMGEEFAGSRRLSMTSESGPDVLVVEVALLDIVSRMPPETAGRTEVYVDRYGEATLRLQLRDGGTGELLARSSDRRDVETPDGFGIPGSRGRLTRATPVTARAETLRTARRWADAATRRIDQLYVQGKIALSKD
jgi:hypothetical protein